MKVVSDLVFNALTNVWKCLIVSVFNKEGGTLVRLSGLTPYLTRLVYVYQKDEIFPDIPAPSL